MAAVEYASTFTFFIKKIKHLIKSVTICTKQCKRDQIIEKKLLARPISKQIWQQQSKCFNYVMKCLVSLMGFLTFSPN